MERAFSIQAMNSFQEKASWGKIIGTGRLWHKLFHRHDSLHWLKEAYQYLPSPRYFW